MTLLAWGIGLILIGGGAAVVFRRAAPVADVLFRSLTVLGCLLAAASPGLLVPMFALGGACLVLGIAPLVALAPAARVVAQMLPAAPDPRLLPAAPGLSVLAAVLAGAAAVVAVLRAALASGRAPARTGTWGCGYPRPTARMQYTASSFGAPLLSAFGTLAKPPVRRTPTSFATDADDRVLSRAVGPSWARVRSAAARLRPLQQGRVTTYLQYIVFTLIILLCVLFASVRRP